MNFFTEFEDYEPLTRVTIPAGTDHFCININILDNKELENNKLFRITIDPPIIPTHHTACSTDVIITDDDGKLLIHVEYSIFLVLVPVFIVRSISVSISSNIPSYKQ